MDSNGYMLGNVVKTRDGNEADCIAAISKGTVHLGKRKRPDDERDIAGIPLTNWINGQSNSPTKGIIIISLKGIRLELLIKRSDKKAILLLSLTRKVLILS